MDASLQVLMCVPLSKSNNTDNTAQQCRIYENYISNSFLHRILAGGTDLVNECRTVTTIFIKIKGITFTTDECLSKSQSALDIVQKSLARYEGTLRQFIVDDKGSVILAYFGLPPYSHENDQLIALRAAMDIQKGFKSLFADGFAIGVATGHVFCGLVGNSKRADYTVSGDSVNMSARLMSNPIAKKSVICDESTYEASKEFLEFENLGEIKVKGKSRPIAIYRPLSVKIRSKIVKVVTGTEENEVTHIHIKEKSLLSSAIKMFFENKRRAALIESEMVETLDFLAKFACEEANKLDFRVL
jgi:class 3 adenylate cyclase